MIEKVNPKHPDKIADRIAGAIVDLAYEKEENPKVAVEVLIGHGRCYVIIESSAIFMKNEIEKIVNRIAGDIDVEVKATFQDELLAKNQEGKIRCADNGIFKGTVLLEEERMASCIARTLYGMYDSDGKYIYDADTEETIICQSNAKSEEIEKLFPNAIINPLGEWTGGIDVDTGATNRKLGSDMGKAITGGGLHGKDLSKADVSVNIYAFLKAQVLGHAVEIKCAIGDEYVDGRPYSEIVGIAKQYIKAIGGFEKFAEWGLF